MRTSTHKFCAGVSNSERLFCCWYLGSKYYKYSTVPVGTLLLVSYLCSIPGTAFSSLRLRLVLGGVLDDVPAAMKTRLANFSTRRPALRPAVPKQDGSG